MPNEIRKVIETWSSKNLKKRKEAQVCLGLIIPILRRLSWNVESHDEVDPEYDVEGGEVDYALLVDQAPKVFIEAKKEGEPLKKHQEQLLDYAFRQGVVMAVLTNGTTWWFYLSLSEEIWENRKFAALDIDESELPELLKSLLSKENVISGDNIRIAEPLLRSRRIEESLPEAWKKVRHEIANRLIDETEMLCRYRPHGDEVEQFLSCIDNQTPTEAGGPEPKADTPSDVSESSGVKGTNDQCFTFLKDSYSANSWRSMLRKLCNILHTKHKERFEATALNCNGRKGAVHFSRNPNDFRARHEVNDSRIYVNIHGGQKQLRVRAYDAIAHFGYAQDDLRFENLHEVA